MWALPPLVCPAAHWTMWIWYIAKIIYLPVWLIVKANQTAHSWYLLNLLFMHFPRTSCLSRCTQCLCLFIFCTLHRKSCYNSTARKLLTLTRGYLAVIVTTSDWFEVQIKKLWISYASIFQKCRMVSNSSSSLFLIRTSSSLSLLILCCSILPAPGETFKIQFFQRQF